MNLKIQAFEDNNEPQSCCVRYTKMFLAWLQEEGIVNQVLFTVQDLYEIYVNQICWKEIDIDPDIPANELIVRT